MFLNSDPVGWDDHVAWIEATLKRSDRELFIAERDGEPVGTARIDYDESRMPQVSITVAPEHRGQGLSEPILAAALPAQGCEAEVKRENLASQRMVERVGFQLVEGGDLQIWRHPGRRKSKKRRPQAKPEPGRPGGAHSP
jgi:RimJ/RimL family protein N-acetyltransferase